MTPDLTLLGGALVGLLGSVHCVGMCGGIVGALSGAVHAGGVPERIPWSLLVAYNAGRIASYTLAGMLAGWLGSATLSLFVPEHVVEVGLTLSGLFLLAFGLYVSNWWQGLTVLERAGARLWHGIEPWSRGLLPVRHPGQALVLGTLWGWLPCGLVYATLVWSLTTADPLRGAALMAAFGLGTLPMLLMMGTAAVAFLKFTRRPYIRKTAGSVIIVLGLLTLFGVIRPLHIGSHPVDNLLCGPDYLPGKVTN
ncbi:MAG: sulfite exporter TauE/SafE family protein [Arenicellales bacterium]|nr:sulfite exporter TauE/SafE family protein [Arenicellales bacterium]